MSSQFLNGIVFTALVAPVFANETNGKPNDSSDSLAWPHAWATCIASGTDRVYASVADGLLLRSGSIVAFSAAGRESCERLYDHPASVWAVAVAPNGSTLASSDYKGNLAIYDIAAQKMAMNEGLLERWARALTFSSDGSDVIAGNEAGKLFVYSIKAGKITKTVELDGQQIFDVAMSPNGKTLAVCDGAGHVHLLSYPELQASREVKCGKLPIWAVAFSSDGKTVFAGGADRQLRSIAIAGETEPTVIGKTSDWITDIDFDAKTSKVAVASMDSSIYLRDGEQFGKIGDAPSGIWSVVFSGENLLTATRKHQVTALSPPWKIELAVPEKKGESGKGEAKKEPVEEEDPFKKKEPDQETPAAEEDPFLKKSGDKEPESDPN